MSVKKGKGGLGIIWGLLHSLKFTIFVLITIALVSIIGTVVEQGRDAGWYAMNYSERWVDIILKLKLDDMYHSPWFTALLILLVVNIIACTIERFPPKWRVLLKKNAAIDTTIIDKLSHSESFALNTSIIDFKDKLVTLLGKRRYKVRAEDIRGGDGSGGFALYAWRGIIGRFGSDVTHVSLLLILLGAIIGSFYGYKDFKAVYVDTSFSVPDSDFELRLDKFWIEYYDSGQIRQYNSNLTVVEEGKDVLTKHIWVNEPLFYKGIRFYQSSYGKAWDRVSMAELTLASKGIERKIYDPTTLKWDELTPIPGSPYSVKLIGFFADFVFDYNNEDAYSKSADPNNPAVKIVVYDSDGEQIATTWLLLNHPGILGPIPGTTDHLYFTGYRPTFYSGLSINKDPGTNIVWLGSCVMGVGFILAFFVYHKRLWVSVEELSEGGRVVKIGGIINKNQLAFDKEFAGIVNKLKLEAGLTEPSQDNEEV